MIDFSNATFIKLKNTGGFTNKATLEPLFVEGEYFIGEFQGMRDFVVFTNKRIISVNVQGISGKKKDYSSLPYSKVTAFSVETAGSLDIDSELELYFAAVGKVKFEFTAGTDIVQLGKIISTFVL